MERERRIRWAPMLPAHKLVALYEANARGLVDGELLDDVGWRLWERLVDVVRVTSGRVRCPACGTEFQVRTPDREPDEAVPCPSGDWQITPREWHASWRHRDLNGRCEEFERYTAAWPKARTARDRMLLIDAVVHALHVASRDDIPGNFAARKFIEGSRPKIVALLDELAHGPGSNIAADARARWQTARDHYATHDRARWTLTLQTRLASHKLDSRETARTAHGRGGPSPHSRTLQKWTGRPVSMLKRAGAAISLPWSQVNDRRSSSGSAGPTRTPTGCCASTSPSAPAWRRSPRPISTLSLPSSTADLDKPSAG